MLPASLRLGCLPTTPSRHERRDSQTSERDETGFALVNRECICLLKRHDDSCLTSRQRQSVRTRLFCPLARKRKNSAGF